MALCWNCREAVDDGMLAHPECEECGKCISDNSFDDVCEDCDSEDDEED